MLLTIAAGLFIAETILGAYMLWKAYAMWQENKAMVQLNVYKAQRVGRALASFCETVGEIAAI